MEGGSTGKTLQKNFPRVMLLDLTLLGSFIRGIVFVSVLVTKF